MTYRELKPSKFEQDDTTIIAKKVFTKTKSGYPRWSATVRKALTHEGEEGAVWCFTSYQRNKTSWWSTGDGNIPLDLLPLILEVFSTPLNKGT